MRALTAISFSGLVLLGGCTLDPDYERPALPVAPSWSADTGSGPVQPSIAQLPADAIGWRDFFKDPRLQRLIEIALRNNRDLRVAVLNVASAEAQVRVQRSDLFPKLDLTGNSQIESIPANETVPTGGTTGSSSSGSSFASGGSNGSVFRYYSAGVGVTSYELDLFGKVRSLTRQAFEQYLSSQETQRNTQITLVSEVGTAYLTLLADQALLHLTQDTLKSQTDSYNLTKLMFDEGTTTALSLKQAETSVDTAAANLAQYQRQVAQDEHALTLLLGQPMPADLPAGKSVDEQGLLADLPSGVPSDLLIRRPDVMAAEHTLLSANANIGAARAAFFPSISLTASGGVASNKLSSLFTAGSTTWSFAPQITLPIFTAGENEANLDVAKIQKNSDIATYEKTIQTAFREVSDALASRSTYVDQIKSQQSLVAASDDSYKLSNMRFREGVDSYLSALDAQRTLYSAQQSLITLKQAQLANLVTLYKSLGGGWNEHTVSPESVASR